jgi:hypothetical protein
MPLRIAALALFTVALGLVGCRDALVDEPLPADTEEPSADSQEYDEIYLKGPEELPIGVTANYRAEPLEDVVEYRWSLAGGTGQITGESSDPQFRVYDITGVEAGSVLLTVRAVGERNEILGVASKEILVIR